MRKNRKISTLASALVIAPLLLGCGDTNTGGGGGLLVPGNCMPGQVLSTDSTGQFMCKSLPSGTVVYPACGGNQALTADGAVLSCSTLNVCPAANLGLCTDAQAMTALNMVNATITSYNTRVVNLQNKAHPRALYVGVTKASPATAAFTSGAAVGIAAAALLCQVDYAGSHMCTMPEMYDSVVNGVINSTASGIAVPKSWIWAPNWNQPGVAALTANPTGIETGVTSPAFGLADNCGGYTDGTTTTKWSGIAVQWATLATGSFGLKFHGGSAALCNAPLPIACCK